MEKRDIDLALAFVHFLPKQERVELLEERLRLIEKDRDRLRENVASLESAMSDEPAENSEHLHLNRIAPWVYHGVRHSLGRAEFEVQWTQHMLEIAPEWGYVTRKIPQ